MIKGIRFFNMVFNRNISLLLFVWIVGVLFIFMIGYLFYPSSGLFEKGFMTNMANWDGGHYIGIANNNYSVKFQHAFFPLYPLMIRFLGIITNNLNFAALAISFVSLFLFVNLFYEYLKEEFDKSVATKTIIAFLFFPMSFYLITAHTESLFLLFTVGTFYFTKKNNLVLATLFAALASATRLIGVAVVVSFFLELYLTKKLTRKNWYVLFAPSGFLLYCLYLWFQTGDPLYFITAEKTWSRTITFPWDAIWNVMLALSIPGYIKQNYNTFLDFCFTIFGIFMVIRVIRTLQPSFALYSLICIILPLLTPTLASMPRYLLPIFPIFIVMGRVKNKFIWALYLMVGGYLFIRSTILFIGGFWVS